MKDKKTVWSCKYSANDDNLSIISDIAKQNNISEICASLLYARGYKTPETAQGFLNFDDLVIHSSLLLKDVEKAVKRIQIALKNDEKIVKQKNRHSVSVFLFLFVIYNLIIGRNRFLRAVAGAGNRCSPCKKGYSP